MQEGDETRGVAISELTNNQEWVTVNRHLQEVGTATCDVSNLILQADILRSEDKNSRAAEILMQAARDVLHYRRLARNLAARALHRRRLARGKMTDTKPHWLMSPTPRSANEIVSDFWPPLGGHVLPVTRDSIVKTIEDELNKALEFGKALGRDGY